MNNPPPPPPPPQHTHTYHSFTSLLNFLSDSAYSPPFTQAQNSQTPFPLDDKSYMGYYGSFGRRRRLPSPFRCRCSKRFRFRLRCGKRFSVHRLRARFMSMFGVLERLRRRYGRALRLFKCRGGSKNSREAGYFGSLERTGSSRVWLVQRDAPHSASMITKTCGLRYMARSNTFQAEAIADCLEFIKGTYSTASVVGHGDHVDRRLRQGREDDSAKS